MDKLELYNKATEAYYSGQEIIPDYEYDALEEELGLKNKNLGSSHSNAYTIKHPFIMGSLSKVQVHDTDKFKDYFQEINKYIRRYYKWSVPCIITPKYDGCSFEVIYSNGNILQASTRGDGIMGKDITQLIQLLFTRNNVNCSADKNYCLRGELLIQKDTFDKKYAEEFKNPRSFVSSLINADWGEQLIPRIYDLSFVIYDTSYQDAEGTWIEYDWKTSKSIKKFIPEYTWAQQMGTSRELQEIYNAFLKYREEKCPYSLDGIVIKPELQYRHKIRKEYPEDCVAIKFKPMLQETIVKAIEWKLGKTHELIPTIIVKPVTMDGKTIMRASAHNYGYLIDNKISIGTKLILSLAGDIIPYIYNVTDSKTFSKDNLGIIWSQYTYVKGCHLYYNPSTDERNKLKFVNSALSLKIPEIGESTAIEIFENIRWRNKDKPYNILCLKPHTIFKALGRGKRAKNVLESYRKIRLKVTLSEVIQSCNFESCGPQVAQQISNKLIGFPYNYAHLPEKAYKWADNKDSPEFKELLEVIFNMSMSLDDFEKETSFGFLQDKTPIIMTGKPTKYANKSEFLKQHPEYRETGSWSEVKIVFTNSLESNSGKMKKASEKGIEIRLY
jgi:NAD-dependent DNA ligase